MPMDRSLYPADWEEIAHAIKEAAGWQCQECERPCRRPGESVDDLELRLSDRWRADLYEADWDDELGYVVLRKAQRFCLTVAHLNHIPSDCSPDNLKALCAPCHCRYDLAQMQIKRRLKQERLGQLSLFASELAGHGKESDLLQLNVWGGDAIDG